MRYLTLFAISSGLLIGCGKSTVDTGDTSVEDPDRDNDGYVDSEDCDDLRNDVFPGAEEVADGADNDCDDIIDEGTDIFDDDGDGMTEQEGDCDDDDATIYEDANEIPYDGIDQDCDGLDTTDQDGDGFDGVEAGGEDCDDTNALIYPDAPESSNGLDDDCDDEIDEGTDIFDDDGDGYSEAEGDCDDEDSEISPAATEIPYDFIDNDCDGYDLRDVDGDFHDAEIVGGRDCDDNDATINAGAEEIPYDGIDQDCDDEDLIDVDGDGFVAEVAGGDDCDDTEADVWPGNPEDEDGLDNDCNGIIDEGTDAYDDDGDGVTENDGDCDDTDSTVSPNIPDTIGDGIDNDCDDLIDEQDLSSGVTIDGMASGDLFGSVLASGDFNGDGIEDLAIGAKSHSSVANSAGAIYFVSSDTASGTVDSIATSSWFGAVANDKLGTAMANMGDIDGDGADELLVASLTIAGTGANQGGAYIIYGDSTGSNTTGEDASTLPDVFAGGTNNANIGNMVAAGDLTADGIPEIILSGSSLNSGKGRVMAIEGEANSSGDWGTLTFTSDSWTSIIGATNNARIGGALEVAEDLDGDGYNELLIHSQEGRVYLFDGNNLGGTLSTGAYDAYFSFNIPDSTFGSEIEIVDVDEDGNLDVIIGKSGNEGQASLFINSGSGFSGQVLQATADATLVGDDSDDGLSSTIAVIDLDNDGSDDLLFGSPGSGYIDPKSGAVISMSTSTFYSASGDTASDLGAIYLGESSTDRAGTGLVAGEDWWAAGTSSVGDTGVVYLFILD
jgi:hypothetical protein